MQRSPASITPHNHRGQEANHPSCTKNRYPSLPAFTLCINSVSKQIKFAAGSKSQNYYTINLPPNSRYLLQLVFMIIISYPAYTPPSSQNFRSKHSRKPLTPPIIPLKPQDTPPPAMESADLDNSLAEMFTSQISMTHKQSALDLQTNDEETQETIPLTLLIKPFGFKTPPPKAIIPRLLQAWNTKKGVSIAPKKYSDDILICLFKDKRDMKYVEKDRAWSVQGAHMMISCWDKRLSLEEIKFDSVDFWIQIRGVPPEMLSTDNIKKLTGKAGKVLQIDWKDSPSLPKCTDTVDVEQSTVGNPRRADCSREPDFLHRSDFCPLPRKNNQASKIQPIFTDTLYSGLIEEQEQIEAHFQSSPEKTPSPLKLQTKPKKKSGPARYCNTETVWTSEQGRDPAQNSSPLNIDPTGSRFFARPSQLLHGNFMDLDDATLITKKRKNDFSMEEFIQISGPYARFFNKVARTMGQAVQEDWNARRSASVEWEPSSHLHPSPTIYLNQGNSGASYKAHEMEEESIPEDIQMAEEAGLNKPPRGP
ncbi:hypothetical protein CRG98_008329 [Punica granatum]|uniref:Uncharacterized protein n=1 Tax=Punica granatum TaxID=22663 RepID=A0A2I0KS87_PUNGR|nr:hypothetical protein CRG98_008329 [Punica granatum]